VAEKTIEFTLEAGKPVKVEAFGFEGQSCREATRRFEEALGGEVVSRVEKEAGAEASAEVRVGRGA